MKLNTTDFLRKCQHPLLLALGSIPIAVILLINLAPELLGRMWILPGAYVLLAWGCIVLPGRRRLLGGILSAALLLALGAWLLNVKANFLLMLLPVVYAALIFVTLPIGGWDRWRELNVAWYVVCLLLYVLLQLLTSGSRRMGEGIYDPASGPVLVCFLALACLLVMALNRASLDSAAMSRRTVPLLMRRQNLVITLAMLVLGVLIAAIPAIGAVLKRVWDWFMQGVAYVAALILSILPENQSAGGGAPAGDPDQLMLGEVKEPSAFMLFLEKVLFAVAITVAAIALFFAGKALIKRLIRLVRYLWGRFSQYSAAAGEDYEDEITDTRDEPGVERTSLLGRLRRMATVDEKSLSPTERVRYRYKRLRQKHTDWTQASTARETLPESAAALYERARYGGETLTEEEAGRFREDTRRV